MKNSIFINRILVVGLGSIGKRHLRLVRKLMPDADIRVLRHQIATVIPDGANGFFSSIEQAVAFAPQIAVIASPATCHLHVAITLAKVGVHLLVEKPLSAEVDGVSELLEVCDRQGVVLLTGYNLRFLPSLQQFRRLINENIIGKIFSVRCEIGQYLPSWRPGADYRQGVSARQELGGGALLELSHELDYLCWIFGDVAWVKSNISRQSDLDINVEDTVHLILGFVSINSSRQLIGSVNLDFIRHDTTRLCIIIGENGSLRWNGLTGCIDIFEAGGKEWRQIFCSPHQADDSYMAEWEHFIRCIHKQEKPLISGEDGLKVLQVIEASRQASISGGQARVEVTKKMENISL